MSAASSEKRNRHGRSVSRQLCLGDHLMCISYLFGKSEFMSSDAFQPLYLNPFLTFLKRVITIKEGLSTDRVEDDGEGIPNED